MRITFLAFYSGFGILTNLALLGPTDWLRWETWAILLFWPAIWFVVGFFVGLAIYLLVVSMVAIYDRIGRISFVRRWNTRRHQARLDSLHKRIRADMARRRGRQAVGLSS
jgi:hypothetical protein